MSENLFGDPNPTVNQFTDGAPGLTLGTRIRFLANGTISALRWFAPNAVPAGTVQWFVFRYNPVDDSSGAEIANGSFGAISINAWNVASFAPAAVNAGDEIIADIWTPDRYVSTAHYFDSDVTGPGGHLLGPADSPGSTPPRRNGRFATLSTPMYPQQGFNATAYYVDVTFNPAVGGGFDEHKASGFLTFF